MLSETQLSVLRLLDELSTSSLNVSECQPQVTAIEELLQTIKDRAAYEQLIAPTPVSTELSFVDLCKRRLLIAQKNSQANYLRLREAKTARTYEARDVAEGDEYIDEKDPASLAQSLREAKSEDITRVLQRMHEMAQAEVLKGEMNISELDMGSRTMRELQEKYSGVDILLNGSKRLVKILDEADKWDRRCMLASLGFLAFVMCYIIYRRILSGPLKILVWSFLKLFGVAKWATAGSSSKIAVPTVASPIATTQVSTIQAIETALEPKLETAVEPAEAAEPAVEATTPEAAHRVVTLDSDAHLVTPRVGGFEHTYTFADNIHSEL